MHLLERQAEFLLCLLDLSCVLLSLFSSNIPNQCLYIPTCLGNSVYYILCKDKNLTMTLENSFVQNRKIFLSLRGSNHGTKLVGLDISWIFYLIPGALNAFTFLTFDTNHSSLYIVC